MRDVLIVLLELLIVWTIGAVVFATMWALFKALERRKRRRQKRMFAVGRIRPTMRVSVSRLQVLRHSPPPRSMPASYGWRTILYATCVADTGQPTVEPRNQVVQT